MERGEGITQYARTHTTKRVTCTSCRDSRSGRLYVLHLIALFPSKYVYCSLRMASTPSLVTF